MQQNKRPFKLSIIATTILLAAIVSFIIHLLTVQDAKQGVKYSHSYKSRNRLKRKNYNTPVYIIPHKYTKNVSMDITHSFRKNISDSFSYVLKGNIYARNVEILKLQLKIELLDSNKQLLYTKYITAQHIHKPVIRPGNVLPFNMHLFKKKNKTIPSFVNVCLYIVKLEQAKKKYAELKKLFLKWELLKPKNMDVIVFLRSENNSIERNDRSTLHLEVMHNGSKPIKRLKLKIEWLDESREPILFKEINVAQPIFPLFKPEQQRVISVSGDFHNEKKKPAGYAVSVIEIE